MEFRYALRAAPGVRGLGSLVQVQWMGFWPNGGTEGHDKKSLWIATAAFRRVSEAVLLTGRGCAGVGARLGEPQHEPEAEPAAESHGERGAHAPKPRRQSPPPRPSPACSSGREERVAV